MVPLAAFLGYRFASRDGERADESAIPSPFESPTPPEDRGGEAVRGMNPFGVYFNPIEFDTETRVRLAQELGVRFFRSYPVLLPTWDGECFEDCEPAFDAGMQYVLNLRNSQHRTLPADPITDFEAYQEEVAEIIRVFKPALIVVEAEEDLSKFFAGTPDQYLAELAAACEVAHRMDTACTNGGLTGPSSTFLVYDYYLATGQSDLADDYARRAFYDYQLRSVNSSDADRYLETRLSGVKALLSGYKQAGVDYVNFHWYVADPAALAETITFFQGATGLPAVINELGPPTEDGDITTGLMQTILDFDLDVAVWFSRDVRVARALVDLDGSLRPSGEAYAGFIRTHFDS